MERLQLRVAFVEKKNQTKRKIAERSFFINFSRKMPEGKSIIAIKSFEQMEVIRESFLMKSTNGVN